MKSVRSNTDFPHGWRRFFELEGKNHVKTYALLLCLPLALTPDRLPANEISEFRYLEVVNHRERISELHSKLESCIDDFQFATEIRISRRSIGPTIQIEIQNTSEFAITGVILRVDDPTATDLSLIGDEKFLFEALSPNKAIIYTEIEPGFSRLADMDKIISVRTVDVIPFGTTGLLEQIFKTRWPFISSAEELSSALQRLCKTNL